MFFPKAICCTNYISKLLWVLQVRLPKGPAQTKQWFKSRYLKGHSEHFGVPFLTCCFKGKWLILLYSLCVSVLFIRVKCGCDCGHNTHLCVKCSLNSAFKLPPGTSPRESELHFFLNWDNVYVGTRCLGVRLLNVQKNLYVGAKEELYCKRTCWFFIASRPTFLWRKDGLVYFWCLRYRKLDIMWNIGGLDFSVSYNARCWQ